MGHPFDGLEADVEIVGADPVLPARCPIGEVAARALAEIGIGARNLSRAAGGDPGTVRTSVAQGAQSIISFALTEIDGAVVPRTNQSNPFVRLHRTADGWFHLHGGFPHLQAGLADLLGVPVDAGFDEVGAAVADWSAVELEQAVADRRLCGAALRTEEEWRGHEHGSIVTGLDPVEVAERSDPIPGWEPSQRRPLAGLRVLDLTRVLAGPTCGRTLAALGAEVLQVTGPTTPHVPVFVVDTGHGKRRAHAELGADEDRDKVRQLVAGAHVIVQGYRPDVLARFGLDRASLRADGFAGVHVNISAYGPHGPFADRAGWEQLAQTVSGIAHLEGGDDRPALLPAAATDYTTGYLAAGAVLRSLATGRGADLDASLCQTAELILTAGPRRDPDEATGIDTPTFETVPSSFGSIRRLTPNVTVEGLDVSWKTPSAALGSSLLLWKGWSNW